MGRTPLRFVYVSGDLKHLSVSKHKHRVSYRVPMWRTLNYKDFWTLKYLEAIFFKWIVKPSWQNITFFILFFQFDQILGIKSTEENARLLQVWLALIPTLMHVLHTSSADFVMFLLANMTSDVAGANESLTGLEVISGQMQWEATPAACRLLPAVVWLCRYCVFTSNTTPIFWPWISADADISSAMDDTYFDYLVT